jgi:hypothetical protein
MSDQDHPPAAARSPAGAEPSAPRSTPGMFAALSVPNFRRYVAGQSAVAGGLYAARSGRTGMARLTKAALAYGIAVGLIALAPTLPTAPVIGAIADAYGPRYALALGAAACLAAAVIGVWPAHSAR